MWGTATSAYQIEGNNTNSDWWDWEKKSFGKVNGPHDISGEACDSYNRYGEDFNLSDALNQNAHRLSIEWARIQPRRDYFSCSEINHYRRVLEDLKKRNIKTVVTLHHFTNPKWFADMGGWENANAPEIFTEYVKRCAESFADLVDYWITINEPIVLIGSGYVVGIWPPNKKNPIKALVALVNLIKAHNEGYRVLKKTISNSKVGFAHNITRFNCSKSSNFLDSVVIKVLNFLFTDLVYIFTKNSSDFFGVNYYLEIELKNLRVLNDDRYGKTEMSGWPVSPQGLYRLLLALKKYNKPILITENGIADGKDVYREEFIVSHLYNIFKAISQGSDVIGYLYWSLLDNFEWHLGYAKKFGLIRVDRENNLERTLRNSAYTYADICKNNCINNSLIEKYKIK